MSSGDLWDHGLGALLELAGLPATGGRPDAVAAGLPALPADPSRVAAGLAAIRARDPAFDEAAFLDGARSALGRASPAIARGSAIVAASAAEAVDSVTVRLDLASDGDDRQEDWVFERPAGSLTVPESRSVTCPLCGAPLELDPDGRCPYCHAHAASARPDWRVASTTRLRPLTQADVAVLAYAHEAAMPLATARGLASPPPSAAAGVDLPALLAAVPDADPYDLIARARQAATDLAGARSRRDLSSVRDQLTQEMAASETAALRAAESQHLRHAEPFLEVGEGRITSVETSRDPIRITISLHMSGERVDFDDRTGAPIGEDQTVHQWVEEWKLEHDPGSGAWRVSAAVPTTPPR